MSGIAGRFSRSQPVTLVLGTRSATIDGHRTHRTHRTANDGRDPCYRQAAVTMAILRIDRRAKGAFPRTVYRSTRWGQEGRSDEARLHRLGGVQRGALLCGGVPGMGRSGCEMGLRGPRRVGVMGPVAVRGGEGTRRRARSGEELPVPAQGRVLRDRQPDVEDGLLRHRVA